MKTIRPNAPTPTDELDELRARLAVAEETLRAIRHGEVDVVLVAAKQGVQLFTLDGAEQAYRVLIESMHEGALLLTPDKTILYANQCFARMVKCPLEQIIGSSFARFLSAEDGSVLRLLLKRRDSSGAKIKVLLQGGDGSQLPGNLSIRALEDHGSKISTFGVVVTDMTDARRSEERLRTLTCRVVQTQEAERGHLAHELHDTVTQMLCAVLVRSHSLVDKLPARNLPAKLEATNLQEIIRRTIEEVERISRGLRPSVLDQLGLVAGLHHTSTEFANRTSISVNMVCVELAVRLPADTELALYRILQEALQNVEKHAKARNVTVHLTKPGDFVQLTVHDDGIGFNPDHHPVRRAGRGGFGILGMRERAAYVGGLLILKSICREGTEIEIRIPLPPIATATPRAVRAA